MGNTYFETNNQGFPPSGEREGGCWIGGDAYTAVAVAKKVGAGSWTVYNIFRDHLGSITHLKTGSTVTEYSYEAWGRRRDKDDWTMTLTSEPALFADRGFTAHEYLEDFKLYNMNGRLYDPVVGRFLSPDPYIQDPGFTQNLNRYSYCLNNPLKYIDPSGEIWNILFVWGGNWLAGGMDRWINQKQSFKQAFSPAKNPVVFSTNFSPSNTTRQNNYGFSHPQIDAQKAANHEELVAQQLDDFVTSQSGRGSIQSNQGYIAMADATYIAQRFYGTATSNGKNIQWQNGGEIIYGNMSTSHGSIGSGYRAKYIYGSYDASNPVHPVIKLAGRLGNWLNSRLYNYPILQGNGYINMEWDWVKPGDTIVDPITPGRTWSHPDNEGRTIFYTDTIFWIRKY